MKIKILVACHKPYKIFKNDVIVPIHVGRDIAYQKNKDGIITEENYNWLLESTIGDNTGENISALNREFCELTAAYWAWKNYEALGNPDYIGLMHYRTFFDLFDYAKKFKDKSFIENLCFNTKLLDKLLKEYDGVISEPLNLDTCFDKPASIKEDVENYYKISEEYHPELYKVYKIQLERKDLHFKNMFILKREDFLEYAETLFDILFRIKEENKYLPERQLGYFAEAISSLCFMHFYENKGRRMYLAKWLPIRDKKHTILTEIIELMHRIKSYIFFNKKYYKREVRKYMIINGKLK